MKIWVDADACPVVIKEILFRAAERTGVQLTLVANKYLRVPRSENIAMTAVESGFDADDDEIVKRVDAGASDIPLAAKSSIRAGAQPARRGVFDREYRGALEYAGFYAHAAGQRRRDQWSAGAEPERSQPICQPSESSLDQVPAKRITILY